MAAWLKAKINFSMFKNENNAHNLDIFSDDFFEKFKWNDAGEEGVHVLLSRHIYLISRMLPMLITCFNW